MRPRSSVTIFVVLFTFVFGLSRAEEETEPAPQDGWFNNLVHPDWGAVDGQLIRRSPSKYMDGVYEPAGQNRPNPFDLSDAAHSGQAGLGSARGRTAMLVYFGQQIVEEILDVQRPGCPREFFNIQVPPDHKYNPHKKHDLHMPVLRSRFDRRTGQSPNNPRQQLNELTPYIDGGLMYGPGKAWTDAIREFKNGWLKVEDPSETDVKKHFPVQNDIKLPFANPPPPRDHYLKPSSRLFRIGNPRGFENPLLLTFGVLWFRWHNHIANTLHQAHPHWNDERLFLEAKKRVIAHHQKIVLYDWLPRWLQIDQNSNFFSIPPYYRENYTDCGKYCDFNGYNPEIHPGISHEFQTAAMRFGHTLVTPGVWVRGPKLGTDCNWRSVSLNVPGQPEQAHAIRLCNAYWNGQETVQNGTMIDDIVRGLASTLSEREDNIVVPDLREHLFGPLEWSRRDLVAINIQRGREHGLTDYNEIREAFALPRITNWTGINNDSSVQQAILKVQDEYVKSGRNATSPDDLDLFVGGLLETTEDGPGPLFRNILLDQFLRIRHGDRFWFENTNKFRQFTDNEIEEIRNVTLRDIILAVTNITEDEIQEDVFIHRGNNTVDVCPQPFQLAADTLQEHNGAIALENCTALKHYDYFSGSEYSFIFTFLGLGLCIPGTVAVMFCMVRIQQKRTRTTVTSKNTVVPINQTNIFQAVEWVGYKDEERLVKIKFDKSRLRISVSDLRGKLLRFCDLQRKMKVVVIRLSSDRLENIVSIRLKGEIDLVLRFPNKAERYHFWNYMTSFFSQLEIKSEEEHYREKDIYSTAETKSQRQEALDLFFRVICLQAFQTIPETMENKRLTAEDIMKVKSLELTRCEFAECLRLKPNSMFVRNMFRVFDTDKDGFIGFQEFLDMLVILSSGKAEEKARMMFNMYDENRNGKLTKEEFRKMIKSLLALSDTSINNNDLDRLIQEMYKYVGLRPNDVMTFKTFKMIFASNEYEETLKNATIGLDGLGNTMKLANPDVENKRPPTRMERSETFVQSFIRTETPEKLSQRKESIEHVETEQKKYPQSKIREHLYEITSYIENYRLQIFWATLYVFIVIGIFVERAHYYSFEREHVGLRRIAGYGVTVTRGAASAMMFTYSSLMVTMCRNTITFLRETAFNRFIPFDSAHTFHKFIAYIALLFTVVHCVGHSINLYHICTQSSDDLNCIFREYYRFTDVLASFHYWAYGTITGLTGIILTLIVIVMYVFALPYARKHLFNAFRLSHKFYILLYAFLVLHGSGRLVQPPLFQFFLVGPLVLFVFDKIVSFSRKKVEILVLKADLLPSGVTALTLKRPINFDYKSGQWVRIACKALNESEYHPLTLTSAPHEETLSLHIRAVGPWTTNIRNVYNPNRLDVETFIPSKICLDGPYGEGHQDWYKFPVSVLIGGGIGVTPFASILKDIVFKSSNGNLPCKKVYFLWITRSQQYFEWLTDIIRSVEDNDVQNIVSCHIFITQFQQKFDLRTTMLYICERHFQRIAGKSLLTGLKSTTHFGRPTFNDFFESLHYEHPNVNRIGVFSCGPPPMTRSVEGACMTTNKKEGFPTFQHHYLNF